jgi:beta-lactamase class A
MKRILFLTTLFLSFFCKAANAQIESLEQQIEKVISTKKATVGVAIYSFERNESLNLNNQKHFPLQSVFKFHIALAVLNEIDKGKLTLNQKIFIKKSDLLPDTWSPIRKKYPEGNVSISLAEILQYTVAQSDNNGCDILLRLIGGPKVVNDYIHDIGVKDVAIEASENEMHAAWNVQFKNWTTPSASVELLRKFYKRQILSKKSYDFLWKTMIETQTGEKRLKGQLPKGTLVAHKTGTSDTNNEGITAAINDIGIVTLPNGKHFAISVFVSDSKENTEANERIISAIAKLAWDYFNK